MGALDIPSRLPAVPTEIDDRKLVSAYRAFDRQNDEFIADVRSLKQSAGNLMRSLEEISNGLEKISHDNGGNPSRQVMNALVRALNEITSYQRFLRNLT